MKSYNSPMKSMQSMESNNSKNIFHPLKNNNLLGLISQFCKINTILKLSKVNKKFKNVVKNLTIFCDFIEERKLSLNMREARELFHPDTKYLIRLGYKLRGKYTSSQLDDFVIEILKFLIKRVIKNEELNLRYMGIGGIRPNPQSATLSFFIIIVNYLLISIFIYFNELLITKK